MKLFYKYFVLISLIFVLSTTLYKLSIANTIDQAMAEAYAKSPKLLAVRASIKATDELVASAISALRPQLSLNGSIGAEKVKTMSITSVSKTTNNSPVSFSLNLNQILFDGGKSSARISSAEALVFAKRAELASVEQNILYDAAISYLNVFKARSLFKLAYKNTEVLKRHLLATNDRFEVGEVTRTDVAQAESRLLISEANQIKASGDIDIARASYLSIIGSIPSKKLYLPKKTPKIPANIKKAKLLAQKSNPLIISSGFKQKAALYDISVAGADLLPKISLQARAEQSWDPNTFFEEYEKYSIGANLSLPLYQGGSNYSKIREKRAIAIQKKREFHDFLRTTNQSVEITWRALNNSRAQLRALKSSVDFTSIALDGVREEALVGTRTTLDVLDAEQELVEANINLINAQQETFRSTYALLREVGLLNASDLSLDVVVYDPDNNYKKVKNLWIGLNSKSK